MASAEELYIRAEKRAHSWFNIFSDKWEDAAALFEKASSKYQARREWEAAGKSSERAAHCHQRLRDEWEAANCLAAAAQSYARCKDIPAAQRCAIAAADAYSNAGRFSSAASTQKKLAELLMQTGNTEAAQKHLQVAADHAENAHQPSQATSCRKSLICFSLENNNYPETLELLKESLGSCSEYAVPPLAAASAVCSLAQGPRFSLRAVESARLIHQQAANRSRWYQRSREATFVAQLLAAADAVDPAAMRELALSRLVPKFTDELRSADFFWCSALNAIADSMENDVDYC